MNGIPQIMSMNAHLSTRRMEYGIPLARPGKWAAAVRYISFFILMGLWWFLTEGDQKVRYFVVAAGFSLVEASWYAVSNRNASGATIFTGWKGGRTPFTTPEQFFCNLLWVVVMLDVWSALMEHISSLLGLSYWSAAVVIILLFPINLWVAEVVMAYGLRWLGFAEAWMYDQSSSWVLFGGAIDLRHFKLWWGMGMIYVFAYPLLYQWSLGFN